MNFSFLSHVFLTNLYFLLQVFNQMVLIFHLDMYFVCSIKVYLYNCPLIFSIFKPFEHFLICIFFSDMEQTLEDLWEICTRRLPGNLLTESSSISSGVQACFCKGMIYNSFISDLFCDLYVYSFSYDFVFVNLKRYS